MLAKQVEFVGQAQPVIPHSSDEKAAGICTEPCGDVKRPVGGQADMRCLTEEMLS